LTVTQVDRKSLLSISGGHPPDVCGFWSFNIPVFADKGALMPLDDLMQRDQDEMARRDREYLSAKGGGALATPENLGFESTSPFFLKPAGTAERRGV